MNIVGLLKDNLNIIYDKYFRNNNYIKTVDTTFITEVQARAFEYCMKLENVDLSNVEIIGDYAFNDCESLTSSINLSSAVSIGERAFAFSSVTEITISASLTTLGDYAFHRCDITAIHYSGTQEQFNALISGSEGNSNLILG